jgi:hypothetical protein
MIDKTKLRGADIITSILFFMLGIWIISGALKMPLRESYAGVNSVWYVSPALLPLIIGFAIIMLSVSIFIHALRNGGLESIKLIWENRKNFVLLSDANIRYASVLVPLFAMVYMNLTRIDFFLTILLFLAFTITVFHLDNPMVFRKTLYFYAGEMALLLILFIFKIDTVLNSLFMYSIDIIALILIIALTIFMRRLMKKENSVDYAKKFKQAMLMTYITPLFIVPIFRFMLRVPLPKEGGIVNLMSLIYYTLR